MEYSKKIQELLKEIKKKNIKFIFMTGGVLSGLGKGVALASTGVLLNKNLKKFPIKADGYLNYDPGTMNPIEHGEVFVLDDGKEVDMDFGHYERFLNISCDGSQNITMGKIYKEIIDQERKGNFLGKTVKLIPEVRDYIEYKILKNILDKKANIVLLEVGGTVGDIENEIYMQTIKMLTQKLGKENVINLHLTFIPELTHSGEQKTKPAQNSLEKLFNRGIRPDVIICRSKKNLSKKVIEKLAVYAAIDESRIISGKDVKNIYEIPVLYKNQKLAEVISKQLDIEPNKEFYKFQEKVEKITKCHNNKEILKIAICGKYTDLNDSYASIVEALNHSIAEINKKIDIDFIDTTEIEVDKLKEYNGIIVPGGFGTRGIEGKIKAIKYARENKIPFLGLCYGLQLAVIEFARNVCGITDAHTTEVEKDTKNPIIDILPGQDLKNLGGTMRLGAYKAILEENTKIYNIYKQKEIYERHRHRYEVNPLYHNKLIENGLIISGKSPDGILVEFIELKDHPFFIATQAHPELKSKLLIPHPIFLEFLKKASNN